MQKNLLKQLRVEVKTVKTDHKKIQKDLEFLNFLLSNSLKKYKPLATEKEKKEFLERYKITEKQYMELVGFYNFVNTYIDVSEKEFSEALNLQWIKTYDFIREVRYYIPNLLEKIAISGPLKTAMNFIDEKIKLDEIKKNNEKLKHQFGQSSRFD